MPSDNGPTLDSADNEEVVLGPSLVIPDIVEVCDVNGDFGFGLDDYEYGLDIDDSLIGDRNPKVPRQLCSLHFEPNSMF